MAADADEPSVEPDVEFRRRMDEVFLAAGLRTGRMVGDSTPLYLREHPGHVVVFNATVVDEHGRALWSGDLDLALDAPRLVEVASALRQPLYVLFDRDTWPDMRFLRAVMVVDPGPADGGGQT